MVVESAFVKGLSVNNFCDYIQECFLTVEFCRVKKKHPD